MKAFDKYEQDENGAFDIPADETFAYKGKTLRVIPDRDSYRCCDDCFFTPGYECSLFCCLGGERKDGRGVVFEEVKEGEPEDGHTGITEKDGKKYRWTKVAAGYIVVEVEG